MSYEIYYARAFIRVGDMYVPMVNQGSNNTWEFSYKGRQIPEKNWQVLNWKRRNRLLFSELEIIEIAKDYEQISQESGTCFRSRNRAFEPGEFERWILCGLKSAYSIEEYVSFGNGLELDAYSATEDSKLYSFKTTSEFFALIDKTEGCKLLNLQFDNNREVYKPVLSENSDKIGYPNEAPRGRDREVSTAGDGNHAARLRGIEPVPNKRFIRVKCRDKA